MSSALVWETVNHSLFRNTSFLAVLVAVSSTSLYGDFRYDETAKITGGAMASMMKVAGVFSKQAREPIKSTVVVKGNRMLRSYADHADLIDLDSETFTDINFQKKTYSVTTFAEFRQIMEDAMRKASGSKEQQPQMTFKASVKQTGQSRTISGLDTKEAILTMEIETTDPESGKKGSMVITSDMWLAPKPAGYDEVVTFQVRMAEKMGFTPGASPFLANPQMAQAMAGLAKESEKLNGLPVFQTMGMGFQAQGQPPAGEAGAAPAGQPEPQPERKAEAPSVGGALGGALGGKLGRFGGFGRKKKEAPKEEAPARTPVPAEQGDAGQSTPPRGALMEMTTEISGISNAAADASQFEIPAGFKKVENERLKRMR